MRYWTSYWKEENWLTNNEERVPLRTSAGSFAKRGISEGDAIYVVSLRAGQMLLGGRMLVDRIGTRAEAMGLRNRNDLYGTDEWVIAKEGSGTPLHLHRQLAPEIAKQLRFESGRPQLRFVNDRDLDGQTLRMPRELTRESASMLDDTIELTDAGGRTGEPVTTSSEQLREFRAGKDFARALHEEVWSGTYSEGSVKQVRVNRFERDEHARTACIRHHGTTCKVCGVDLTSVYGPVAAGFIHVHHLLQLSDIRSDYTVNPVEDLVPVCPNCHAIIHRHNPPYSIREVKRFVSSSHSTDE
jgi:hypothetical protein